MRASSVLLLWLCACAALAQDYPARQVRVLVGYPPEKELFSSIDPTQYVDASGEPEPAGPPLSEKVTPGN